LKNVVPVFHPQPAERFRLTQRIKEGFDPLGLLNPGRMYPGV
jgi:glycolate oxidase FAD binding subunit